MSNKIKHSYIQLVHDFIKQAHRMTPEAQYTVSCFIDRLTDNQTTRVFKINVKDGNE